MELKDWIVIGGSLITWGVSFGILYQKVEDVRAKVYNGLSEKVDEIAGRVITVETILMQRRALYRKED